MSQPCVLARQQGKTAPSAVSRVLGPARSGTRTETQQWDYDQVCGGPQVPVGPCNKRLKFIKVIFWSFDRFQKSAYGLLRINPHHAMMWQTSLLLRQSNTVITVFMGVMENWRKGKLLETMVIKKPSSHHISETESSIRCSQKKMKKGYWPISLEIIAPIIGRNAFSLV